MYQEHDVLKQVRSNKEAPLHSFEPTSARNIKMFCNEAVVHVWVDL
jgi:hypothetical protein